MSGDLFHGGPCACLEIIGLFVHLLTIQLFDSYWACRVYVTSIMGGLGPERKKKTKNIEIDSGQEKTEVKPKYNL